MARSKRENQGILDDSKNPAREGMRRKGTHYAHSHGLPWLRICASTAGDAASIPGRGAILHAMWSKTQTTSVSTARSISPKGANRALHPAAYRTGVDTEVCVSSTVSNE